MGAVREGNDRASCELPEFSSLFTELGSSTQHIVLPHSLICPILEFLVIRLPIRGGVSTFSRRFQLFSQSARPGAWDGIQPPGAIPAKPQEDVFIMKTPEKDWRSQDPPARKCCKRSGFIFSAPGRKAVGLLLACDAINPTGPMDAQVWGAKLRPS